MLVGQSVGVGTQLTDNVIWLYEGLVWLKRSVGISQKQTLSKRCIVNSIYTCFHIVNNGIGLVIFWFEWSSIASIRSFVFTGTKHLNNIYTVSVVSY